MELSLLTMEYVKCAMNEQSGYIISVYIETVSISFE